MQNKKDYSTTFREFFHENFFADLFDKGITCSNCNDKLENWEIDMHKYVCIVEPKAMQCQKCWLHDAYETTPHA